MAGDRGDRLGFLRQCRLRGTHSPGLIFRPFRLQSPVAEPIDADARLRSPFKPACSSRKIQENQQEMLPKGAAKPFL
jgi:hypothetical protein